MLRRQSDRWTHEENSQVDIWSFPEDTFWKLFVEVVDYYRVAYRPVPPTAPT